MDNINEATNRMKYVILDALETMHDLVPDAKGVVFEITTKNGVNYNVTIEKQESHSSIKVSKN